MPVYKGSKTKDGRSFYFRKKYIDVFGMQKDYTSRKYLTKHEAEQEEAKFILKVKEVSTSSITLKEAYSLYRNELSHNVKKQTLIKTDNLFRYFEMLQDEKITSLNVNHYRKFKLYLDSLPYQAHYKNKILGVLRRVLQYSARYYGTPITLVNYIETYRDNSIKKEMEFFTFQEYKKFRKVIPELEWQVFFDCLYYLGLRQGELQALAWSDIDFDKKEVIIKKTLTTKIKGEKWTISTPKTKNSIRTIPLPEKVYNGLKMMLKQALEFKYFKYDMFVFGMIQPFKETNIQKHKNKYCDLANLKRIRIHDFRHSCASLLISKGASIALVSKYLGHGSIKMTLDTYTHLYKNELVTISNQLDNLI